MVHIPFPINRERQFDVHSPETAPLATLPLPLTGAAFAHVVTAGTSGRRRKEIPVLAIMTVTNAPILGNEKTASNPGTSGDIICETRYLGLVKLSNRDF